MITNPFAIGFVLVSILILFSWEYICKLLDYKLDDDIPENDYPPAYGHCNSAEFQKRYRRELLDKALKPEHEVDRRELVHD